MHVKRWIPLRSREGGYWRTVHPYSSRVVRPFDSSVDNVVSGMKERVFFLDERGTTRPQCRRNMSDAGELVDMLVSSVGHCSRVSGAEFLRTRSGSKRTAYETALKRLRDAPRTLTELSKIGFFVKTEATQHLKRQVPRIISPRSYEFNYLLGRYTLAIEHPLFEALPSLFKGVPVIAKGRTQQEKAQLIVEKLKPGWVCVGLDASRFDQSIGETLLRMEHSVYTKLFPGDRLLPALLKQQLNNVGRALCRDGCVKARIGAMRCSGDQNTSLGNCLISCLLAALFFREHGIDGDVLNDGDDLLMFVPENQLAELSVLPEWYLQWGLRMKVEPPARVPEQVEFCQAKVVYGPDGWILVRDYRKVLNTDYCGNSKVDEFQDYRVHIRNVGLCGLSMAAGIPILQAYHALGVRQGSTGKWTSDFTGKQHQMKIQLAAGYAPVERVITADTRLSFEKAFGLSPPVQIAMEEELSSLLLAAQPLDLRQDLILE